MQPLGEPIFTCCSELENSASITLREPAKRLEPVEYLRRQRPGQVPAPDAPVHTSAAERLITRNYRRQPDRTKNGTRPIAQHDGAAIAHDERLEGQQAIEHEHPQIARKMVVTNPSLAQGRLSRSGPETLRAGLLGQVEQCFERLADIWACKHIVTMPTRFAAFDQASLAEFSDVKAGSLQRHASFPRQFTIGECAARQQRRQHRATRWVGNQSGDDREIWSVLHDAILIGPARNTKMIATVRSVSKRFGWVASKSGTQSTRRMMYGAS